MMNKLQVLTTIDKKVREVALVFSQNSTALAREMTLQMAIKDITEAMESLLTQKEEGQNESKPKPTRKANS
jgi:hypothetical protein